MAADPSIGLTSPEAAVLYLEEQLPFAPMVNIAPFAMTGRSFDRCTAGSLIW